jgi:hypothetical protein
MRVLVCGGRDFADREVLFATLTALHAAAPITLLVHGAAKGADRLAGEWAEAVGIPVAAFPADWKRYRGAAGPKRNKQMLVEGKPDLVVAFPGGKGTGNMVGQAEAAGVLVPNVGVGGRAGE